MISTYLRITYSLLCRRIQQTFEGFSITGIPQCCPILPKGLGQTIITMVRDRRRLHASIVRFVRKFKRTSAPLRSCERPEELFCTSERVLDCEYLLMIAFEFP